MSSLYNELNYTENIKEIKGVQFGVLSPTEIKNRSVVHVTQTVLYDGHGEPIVEGLFDSRMGVIDHGKICPTDNLDNRFCPGYFGHIELARPVFHIQFIQIIISLSEIKHSIPLQFKHFSLSLIISFFSSFNLFVSNDDSIESYIFQILVVISAYIIYL